jgi:hypothetical protein
LFSSLHLESHQTAGIGSSGPGLGTSQFDGRPTFPPPATCGYPSKVSSLQCLHDIFFAQDLQASNLLVYSTTYSHVCPHLLKSVTSNFS